MNRSRSKRSAGVLVYRSRCGALEVLLGHPGGPMWATKDAGAWGVFKGEYEEGEAPVEAARRELEEETGMLVAGELVPLGEVTQKSGKVVTAFALAQEFDPATLRSNLCEIEWPPRSGKRLAIPEIDRAAWFTLEEAAEKMNPGQVPLLARLQDLHHPSRMVHGAAADGTDE